MKILHINFADLIGNRFNGRNLSIHFNNMGHDSEHCVWIKHSPKEDPFTWRLFNIPGRELLFGAVQRLERRLSVQSLLSPFSYQLFMDKRFREADIVHYHIIHTGFFSLKTLPALTARKPSVWTIHDPWAMTGHCIYPYDCERWKTGCGECPYLETHFPLRKDRTAYLWQRKKEIYSKTDIDIILASDWMVNMARQSPLLRDFNIHKVNFGLDLELFRPMDSREAKKSFGIDEDEVVISFRSTTYEFKGLDYIKKCLRGLQTDKKVCLLTFNEKGLMDEFGDRYHVVDLGWVNDENELVKAYNAADIFLMPSTAEAFGMMAMEAMACAKPVIVFEGTSLPETVFAPDGGIAVKYQDADALRAALSQMIEKEDIRANIGAKALEFAKANYNFEDHANNILNLYENVIDRRNRKKDN